MNDLCDIVVPIALQHTNEATCTAPWFVADSEYPQMQARYKPLVNGEEAFAAVHLAIAKAKQSVNIICWGFQPSMYFVRDRRYHDDPDALSELCIGELLERKAKQGVKVRVLGWRMFWNFAGLAGEANLPGNAPYFWDATMQSATPEQHDFDHRWFSEYAVADDEAAGLAAAHRPLFVGRDFDGDERKRIEGHLREHSVDKALSDSSIWTMANSATHHQKMVLVDYELPADTVGFVMGHNMLDEYWDTDNHTALRRGRTDKPAPNRGPRGFTPRQDISCRVTGPILEYLHRNFAQAWQKETGETLPALHSDLHESAKRFPFRGGNQDDGTALMAQLLRTQAQVGVRDIEKLYLQTVNNTTQFVYVENQYFRWPPFAEALKKTVDAQMRMGRKPEEHGNVHLFVVTNDTDEGMGKGTVNTQRMLECLGRADTIPEVTKQMLIDEAKQAAPPKPRPDGPKDFYGKWRLAEWEARYGEEIKAIEQSTVHSQDIPGLKVHVCSLVAPDSPPGKPCMPVYIHSKLMIVNDVFTTHGSANLNTRSMEVDSELNIAHEWASVSQALRRRLWELHTAGMGAQDQPKDAFDAWKKMIKENRRRQGNKEQRNSPFASLVEFHYGKSTLWNLD
ncbi:hypothetical protein PKB_2180 [Pseudomonas knackmussii B13]|uniref:PLD phosphodiesterase domain-containing protein n=1 Tax=Pseudomonas knackmussii (strain DSM 6978 / CCUG 54928 / LMG 23759 / B13) TaxID=1301098 RepID=A0A024HGA2_PSEKB|nr:phospholipase [Pseudomonas knackmussii]CDF83527.1 hypothetical protein PKB_2180 [Pseudomonas knackmussii B13]